MDVYGYDLGQKERCFVSVEDVCKRHHVISVKCKYFQKKIVYQHLLTTAIQEEFSQGGIQHASEKPLRLTG